jgi:hypothetical protein
VTRLQLLPAVTTSAGRDGGSRVEGVSRRSGGKGGVRIPNGYCGADEVQSMGFRRGRELELAWVSEDPKTQCNRAIV